MQQKFMEYAYVAPEVLRGKPYTQAADIYSFGMVMYFVATGRQPFADCAHNEFLVMKICNGVRPEITEKDAPECYIDLVKKCWDPNPDNRPNAKEIEDEIKSFEQLYRSNDNNDKEIVKQFEEAYKYKKANLSAIKNNQALLQLLIHRLFIHLDYLILIQQVLMIRLGSIKIKLYFIKHLFILFI